jgi:hypothetical protein
MNGDNNLETYALLDFDEIAKVAISDKVNVLVQLDRIGDPNASNSVNWAHTIRFKMKKNIFPLPDYKAPDGDLGEQDMGDGNVLANFVEWSKKNYPAKRYMLIIWDHGQGWRFTKTVAFDGSSQETKQYFSDRSSNNAAYKSVSHDETNKSELYNREIQDSLSELLKNQKINLLGFDACLMAMIETGYAFRGIANYMVASEELEPGEGWNYTDWLTALMKKPTMVEIDLGKVIVESYKKTYINKEPNTTLSCIDLNQMENVADQIDKLSNLLISELSTNWMQIKKMREECNVFAPESENPFHHIDIVQFCLQITKYSTNRNLKEQASVLIDAITRQAIKYNYAGESRRGNFGSYGLAIYFPKTGTEYSSDKYEQGGYKKENNYYPVEFVQNKQWADFLHAYFKIIQ